MFRINTMSLVGLEQDREEGLMLRWLPEGFLIEMAKQKVCLNLDYRISSVIRRSFFPSKTIQKF